MVAEYGDDLDPSLRLQLAIALIGKGRRLESLDRWAESIEVYGEVVARFGEDTDPGIRQVVEIAHRGLRSQ